jgi:polyisoprenoid-binding protein YceI
MKTACLFLLLTTSFLCYAQVYTPEKARIVFFAKTPAADIDAVNNTINSHFEAQLGTIDFSLNMKDFDFKKSLMKEHFDTKYLETGKYPQATFRGKLLGYGLNMVGRQEVHAVGMLTIHGVTKEIDVACKLEFKDGKVLATTKFQVALKDYDIKEPQLLWQTMAKVIDVTVDLIYKAP